MKIEFHFDFGSPNAYLSHLVLKGIEQRTGEKIQYVPVLLGGVFKATGNASPAVTLAGVKNKGEYQGIETARFLKKHGITCYNRNPFFPVNTLQIMRGAIFAQGQGYFQQYVDEVYHHMWSEPKKMDEVDIIKSALESSGLPGDEIVAGTQDPAVKQALIGNTERSVEMGSFGSPTFYVENEIFFGKDKLVDVEEEINSRKEG
ncbi:MAG: 2-hydroxychromene-2-carboxylate isomerase [Gammaproteobacteria bacterium]|nr:2-hydroxychromene-2-carboxylate isomerase [Gammaproteobacteria bacterium]